jgi:hypothetical protein
MQALCCAIGVWKWAVAVTWGFGRAGDAVDSDAGVLLLLREGASSSLADTQGRSPLLVAAEAGNLAALKALPLVEGLRSRVRPCATNPS